MSIAAVASALWPGFRKLLLRIGRWLARVLAEEGVRFLVSYMRQRVRVFRRRLQRILARKRHSEWRPRFLRGRIERWNAAARWLEHNSKSLRKRVVRDLDSRIDDAIPEESPWESERAWRRLKGAA